MLLCLLRVLKTFYNVIYGKAFCIIKEVYINVHLKKRSQHRVDTDFSY